MAERTHTWHAPFRLEDVPETGLHVDLTPPEDGRAVLAEFIEVNAVPRLEAAFDLARQGATRLRVTGRVSATIEQRCVVTLDPVTNEVQADVDVVFAPRIELPYDPDADDGFDDPFNDEEFEPSEEHLDAAFAADEMPEPLAADGTVDLGALAVEFLLLAIDPFPRKPGAEFKRSPEQGATVSPFAELARLKARSDEASD